MEYQAFGSGAVIIAAAMGQAFSIQSFFIPVLKKNPNPEKYIFYTMLAYVIGGCAYFYIAYMGSFGINLLRKVFCIVLEGKTPRQFKITSAKVHGRSKSYKLYILFISIQSFLSFY